MPIEVVQRQAAVVAQLPLTASLLHSVLNHVFILNEQRQVVFASKNVEGLMGGGTSRQMLGLRPGELLGCLHAENPTGGCGTSLFCGECGALQAILSGLAGRTEMQECRLTRWMNCREEALDLVVYGSPLQIEDEKYVMLAVMDISHEKRRHALERTFFHDLLNSAGGLEGYADLLANQVPAHLKPDMQILGAGLRDMLEEVRAQRDLTAAERAELAVHPTPLNSTEVLEGLVQLYQKHQAARGRSLQLASGSVSLALETDAVLLKRVLGNLIKNAMEAVPRGAAVRVGCDAAEDKVRFWVQNPGVMPQSAQLQVFQRSFSTKGTGRGLGTYSVKLFTEGYLNGRVGFTSDAEHGTLFFVVLPRSLTPVAAQP